MSVLPTGIAAPTGGYEISRSVRLRSSASANFTRTPASSGNMKTWTWSAWVKRGALSQAGTIWGSNFASGGFGMAFGNYGGTGVSPEIIGVTLYAVGTVTTSAVFRDPSAWYHIVARFDSTQATQANRFRLYVNGVQQTLSSSLNVTLNADYHVNASGRLQVLGGESGYYNDCYLTEVNHIDGQSLDPSSFGETDTTTGVWKPKRYAGTYGTNGFYLNFSDNSAATAAAIGADSSGNGNNWTPNNISVTSGVTYDSMLDSPTMYADGGNGRGNYAVMNPLDKNTQVTTADGNLAVSWSSSGGHSVRNTFGMTSGKWYCEMVAGGTGSCFGIATASANLLWPGNDANGYGYRGDLGQLMNNGSATVTGMSTFTTNNVIGMAFDADSGKIWFSKDGTWYNSGDPAAGTNATKTGIAAGTWFVMIGYITTTSTAYFNAGQRPFAHTPPTGFKALNTQNLPDATIKKGSAYFDATTYTGTGATQTIVNSGGMQPDFVWTKARSAAIAGLVYDSVRGATKYLQTNSTGAEGTGADSLTAFASNGFTVGADTSTTGVNQNTTTYVGWQWKAAGSTVSNTSGTITSTVNAGVSQGFSVVTYTGTGTSATCGHGLGVTPSMVIWKNRSDVDSWIVYHSSLTTSEYLILNTTGAKATYSGLFTGISSTLLPLNSASSAINASAKNYVAYCFAEVAGYSKFGSYTGNSNADGPFVYLGFRPRWLMVKRTDTSQDWMIIDTARDQYNVSKTVLAPNSSLGESSFGSGYDIDILSNGFKFRNGVYNAGSGIYAAFAESPFRYSLAR